MLNEWLLLLAQYLAAQPWSIGLHESIYMYAWIETTHVLTLAVFLGMLFIIDLRMLGWAFTGLSAADLADRLDRPMILGFLVMIATGLILYYAIPVRTTQSIWFRIKVVLLIAAGINAWLFRRRMQASVSSWHRDAIPPAPIRRGAARSLLFWAGVVFTGRAIAYDWYDCHKPLSAFMLWAAGCVDPVPAH
jgi:hypothetical protein